MSILYPAWPLTNYPNALDKNNSNIRKDIVDLENRTSNTDPALYYVLSNDLKALQQAVFSIQETLGVTPQSGFGSVGLRITALEDYTDLDARYGGATWASIAAQDRPTIMSHLHDGGATGASKINLASHVTGKLSKANVNLTRTDAVNGITGDDIAVSTATAQTISSRFNDKMDKVGGTVQGQDAYLTVSGPFNSRIYKEADAYLCIPASGAIGANIADVAAFSGTARRALSGIAAGNLLHYTSQLRYGEYSSGIRAKVSNTASLNAVAKVRLYSGSTWIKDVDIRPNAFESTDYQMFHVAFTHKGDWNINVYIYWNGLSVSDLTVDSLIITPLHLTVYDLD